MLKLTETTNFEEGNVYLCKYDGNYFVSNYYLNLDDAKTGYFFDAANNWVCNPLIEEDLVVYLLE